MTYLIGVGVGVLVGFSVSTTIHINIDAAAKERCAKEADLPRSEVCVKVYLPERVLNKYESEGGYA